MSWVEEAARRAVKDAAASTESVPAHGDGPEPAPKRQLRTPARLQQDVDSDEERELRRLEQHTPSAAGQAP